MKTTVMALLFSSIAVTNATQTVAAGDVESYEFQEYSDYIGALTSVSPAEGAGSHGSIGLGLGLGLSVHRTPNNRLIKEQFQTRDDFGSRSKTSDHKGQRTIPRLIVYKGLSIPVDFGVTLARVPGTSATLAGGYIQWTLFEGFRMPALATRIKHGRIFGLPSTEGSSTGIDAVASMGFFRLVTAFGTYGIEQTKSQTKTQGETATALITSDEEGDSADYAKQFRTQSIGLQLQVIPQFLTSSIEYRSTKSQSSYLGKISVGI